TEDQFNRARILLRKEAGHIGDDVFVHGSRVKGTARPDSDVDIGIRVSADRFDELIEECFGSPNPGSAAERTMQHALKTGKIQAGDAGLRKVRKQLSKVLGRKVDVSIVRDRGPFDRGPYLPAD